MVRCSIGRVSGGALDAHRELHHAARSAPFEVAEADLGQIFGVVVGDGLLARLALGLEARLVDRHHRLERPGQGADLGGRLALHRSRHHRGRRLADRAALPPMRMSATVPSGRRVCR
jgi:hypothetical protein